MAFEKILGDACPCHAERSEASAWLVSRVPAPQMLSAAKHDIVGYPRFLSQPSSSRPYVEGKTVLYSLKRFNHTSCYMKHAGK